MQAPPNNAEYAPIYYPSQAGLPPAYLQICGWDPLRDEGLLYEKLMRDASLFLHRDATVDIARFKIVKAMFPRTAGRYAGPEA